MKDINTIEKALVKKGDAELKELTTNFINSIKELDLRYGYKSSYFDLKSPSRQGYQQAEKISCVSLENIKTILFNMLKDQFSQRMLNKKSKELLDKLEIL